MKTKYYDIIECTKSFVVLQKYPGVLSVPNRSGTEPNLKHLLTKTLDQQVFPVHRLDKDTSGVMVYALDADTHRALNTLFQKGAIHKTYLAITKGRLFVDEGVIDQPLLESGKGLVSVSSQGKSSITSYRVLTKFKSATYLELKPETGRTHQIRVHLSHAGYPLLVDPVYGDDEAFYLSSIKKKKFNLQKHTDERPLISRLTLHSHSLKWIDPQNKHTYHFEAPLLKDMKATINQLTKWD